MSHKAHAAIFDLDGTLADTFPLIVSSWNAAMQAALGRQYTADEVISRFGIPDVAMIRRELQPQNADAAVEHFLHHYETNHAIVRPFPGIEEMLNELHHRRIPMALVSGKGRKTCQITVDALGWRRFFKAIISGEDVAHQKPHPEGALLAAQSTGVDPRHCAFIGDAPADLKTGQAAGMLTIAAAWHPIYLTELRKLGPDYFAQTPAEVLEAFEKMKSEE